MGVLERFQLRGGLLSIFGEADPKTRVSPISPALLTGPQKGAIPGPEARVGAFEPRRGFHGLRILFPKKVVLTLKGLVRLSLALPLIALALSPGP